MSQMVKFVVKAPAQKPSPPGPPIPDATPMYQGTAINDVVFNPKFGQATVTGGQKVGNSWVGCTYVAPPYAIPGKGDVEFI